MSEKAKETKSEKSASKGASSESKTGAKAKATPSKDSSKTAGAKAAAKKASSKAPAKKSSKKAPKKKAGTKKKTSKRKSSGKSLVIVESPTKAKTLKKFLPSEYEVEATMGHIRDLPQTAAEVPEKYKSKVWGRIGVNWNDEFKPVYVVPKSKKKIIKELSKKVKTADTIYLATDEDREGESISWHLVEVLKPKVPIKRMVFHEITKKAILHALENTRDIKEKLVKAQETRRILDRLVGFTLSPLLWKKIGMGLSAGRVQSAALRLLVERERQRADFVKAHYWSLSAQFTESDQSFLASLQRYDGKRIAIGKDFNEKTGKLNEKTKDKLLLLNETSAKALQEELQREPFSVDRITRKNNTVQPPAPYITSTLQQDGNRRLGLSARDTMSIAQSLYETGLITYMRTDSPTLSAEGINGARQAVEKHYGTELLEAKVRQFSAKSKSQEAHEAIRPSGESFVAPKNTKLSGNALSLYTLIWNRTLACQMKPAKKQFTQVVIKAGKGEFQASGTVLVFPGFLKVYQETSKKDDSAQLPSLKEKQALTPDEVTTKSHETKPVPRFNEASLVQRLEKEGVGRPSTYASIIQTMIDRGYVYKSHNALVATFKGFAVTQLLERHFGDLVNLQFTSGMEASLDEIAEGKVAPVPYLTDFYLGDQGLRSKVEKKSEEIVPKDCKTIDLKNLNGYRVVFGRYGPYVLEEQAGVEEKELPRASLPDELAPSEVSVPLIQELIEDRLKGPKSLGIHPKEKKPIYCLKGRYGAYLQLGDQEKPPAAEAGKGKKKRAKKPPKPKRVSLPPNTTPEDITLEQAIYLLSLPLTLGKHPEKGEEISLNLGRYGPYVKMGSVSRSLGKTDDLYGVSLQRATQILNESGRRGRRVLREIGEHPEDKTPLVIYEGKYGPYVKYGKVNASIPKEKDVASLTLEEALVLITERQARMHS